MNRTGRWASAALSVALLSGHPVAAAAQSRTVGERVDEAAQKVEGVAQKAGETAGKAGDAAGKLAMQPAKDFGLEHTDIPPILQEARNAPYDLDGLGACQALSAEVSRLNAVLGPDYDAATEAKDDKAKNLAKAGGNAALGAIIPFRGLVREVSGAAGEQRAMNAAIDAGYARRGFLRGVHRARGCRTAFTVDGSN